MSRGRPFEIKRPRQQAFCRAMAATRDAEYAAWKAGYRDPKNTGRKMMTKPTVQAEVADMALRLLAEEGVDMAVRTIMEIMPNKAYKPADRLKAAGMAIAVRRDNQAAANVDDHAQLSGRQIEEEIRATRLRLEALGTIKSVREAEDVEFVELVDQAESSVFD